MNKKKIFIKLAIIIIFASIIILVLFKSKKQNYEDEFNVDNMFNKDSIFAPIIDNQKESQQTEIKENEKNKDKEEIKEKKKSVNKNQDTKTWKESNIKKGIQYYCEIDKEVYDDTIELTLHIFDSNEQENNDVKATFWIGSRRTTQIYKNNDKIILNRKNLIMTPRRFVISGATSCIVYFNEEDKIENYVEPIVEENNDIKLQETTVLEENVNENIENEEQHE